MREVYSMLDSREVYLVPNFISEGYFCQEVLPRELCVSGPVSQYRDKKLYYCAPVGVHANMTRLLLQRADEVAPGVPREKISLIIVGHGTSLNENSRKVIEHQVELIRTGGHGFAEVLDAYMEEAPLVADWHKLTSSAHVVVVPFFIADGLHSFQDIPVLLGIESEPGEAASQRNVFRQNPHRLRGRCLYYSSAIGTESHMADVVLDQIADFDRAHRDSSDAAAPCQPRLQPWLATKLEAGELRMGEIMVRRVRDGFDVFHARDEAGLDACETSTEWTTARAIANTDAAGAFRPLKSAPTLRSGWRLSLKSLAELHLALDALYPAALGMAMEREAGSLRVTSLREHLGRQTGMYRFASRITDDQAQEMVARCCDTKAKCLRRIEWEIAPGLPLAGDAAAKATAATSAGNLPLLCAEACPFVLGDARRIAQENHQRSTKTNATA